MREKLEYVVLDMIESASRNARVQPLNLGGLAGGGGGVGGPPGGFIGWLPQTRVAYDDDEIASSGIPASGYSLLDNLNHIRYRLNIIESGGVGSPLVVEQEGGTPINNVDRIIFSGLAVVDLGNGDVKVVSSGGGGGGDGTYLRLDATNDPITGELKIQKDSFPSYSPTPYLLELTSSDTGGVVGGLHVLLSGGFAARLESADNQVVDINQIGREVAGDNWYGAVQVSRYGLTPTTFNEAAIYVYDSDPTSTYLGGTIRHYSPSASIIVDINPYAGDSDSLALFDAVDGVGLFGRLLSLRNQGNEYVYITGPGSMYIPSGQTYNINGTPHTHSYEDLTNHPTAETNANDMYNVSSPGGVSAFAGTIASLPGGATLTYNVVSGQEGAMVPVSTSQLAKMRLYNTTRGTSALISNCVTGTNTLTLTANVPAGWQVGDTITIASQTVSGGGWSWVDLEITSGPTGKRSIFVNTQIQSATAGDAVRLHPFEASFSASKFVALSAIVAAPQVVNGFGLQKIVSNVFCIAWNGSPTAIVIREAGYL